MGFKDDVAYARGHEFTQEELLSLHPRHIAWWMSLCAYGTADPGPDDRPILHRSSGLGFAKKATSFFMPNKNTKWNVESETGNPTMSVAVNELIKVVKKAEVRKRGKKLNAKWDLKRAECRKSLRILEGNGDFH